MTTKVPKRPRGRPPGSTTPRTVVLSPVRCTPEQRDTFQRLGGPDWLRRQLDLLRPR